jgi:hypothetical protein
MATRASQFRSVGPALVEQRGMPRHSVVVTKSSVRNQGGRAAEALLHDISLYGCRFAGRLNHAPGDRLWLRFEGSMPIAATVVWNDGAYIGCRFDETIDRGLLRSLTLVIC